MPCGASRAFSTPSCTRTRATPAASCSTRPGPTGATWSRCRCSAPTAPPMRRGCPRRWSGPGMSRSGRHCAPTSPSGPAEPRLLGPVPVEQLHPVPVHHAGLLRDVIVEGLEILDPVRLAGDVGVDGERHDLRPLRPFLIQPVELVDGAL